MKRATTTESLEKITSYYEACGGVFAVTRRGVAWRCASTPPSFPNDPRGKRCGSSVSLYTERRTVSYRLSRTHHRIITSARAQHTRGRAYQSHPVVAIGNAMALFADSSGSALSTVFSSSLACFGEQVSSRFAFVDSIHSVQLSLICIGMV